MNGGRVTRAEINKVWGHIETTNKEMGEICERVARVEENTKLLKWLGTTNLLTLIGLAIFMIQFVIGR